MDESVIGAVTRAVEAAGGQRALARQVGVHESMVGHWLHGRRPVGVRAAAAIERATAGAVRAEELAPGARWARVGPEGRPYVDPEAV